MSTRLLLVRHGQIGANLEQRWHGSTESDLTEQGREEARRLAAHLQQLRPGAVAVYTSPLRRAQQTAKPIADALHVPLVVAPGLAEFGIGILENETYADLAGRHRFFEQIEADLDWAPTGGESLNAVGTRVVAAWYAIAKGYPDTEVVAVSHGAAIAAGLALLLHQDPRTWVRYRPRNTGVSELELGGPAPRLLGFDVIEHLS